MLPEEAFVPLLTLSPRWYEANIVDEARTVWKSLPKVITTLLEPLLVAFKLGTVLGVRREICRRPASWLTDVVDAGVEVESKRSDIEKFYKEWNEFEQINGCNETEEANGGYRSIGLKILKLKCGYFVERDLSAPEEECGSLYTLQMRYRFGTFITYSGSSLHGNQDYGCLQA